MRPVHFQTDIGKKIQVTLISALSLILLSCFLSAIALNRCLGVVNFVTKRHSFFQTKERIVDQI